MDIPEMMKAVVKTQKTRGAAFQIVPVPEVGPGEVLVKVRACAICGTDVHMYQWNAWANENVEKSYSGLPRIMGHEFSGDIVKVGEGVTKVKVGDRIAAETHIPCGQCYLCRTGNGFNCQNVKRFKNGVYAEYALIPEMSAVLIPDSLSYEEGAVMEPFSVAVHGTSFTKVAGDTVGIIGAGPIGLFTVKIAKAMGASEIFITDVSDYRLNLAKKSGATHTFNPNKVNVVEKVKELTGGLGLGTIFEISGNVKATKQAFEMLRKCGTMVMTGLPSEPLVLDAAGDIVWKAAKIFGVHGRDVYQSWETTKGLLGSGCVDVKPILTHYLDLFTQFDEGFGLAEKGLSGKVIFILQ
ncbi:L-threonine 3-dehydrogenase [bioreactor metagenome]|uniref:L-threonine 3-dehydrogenase n=1 Tax=bioreactor metagenome TaxID=1076179 RepID=A0A645BM89_9ZZZZ